MNNYTNRLHAKNGLFWGHCFGKKMLTYSTTQFYIISYAIMFMKYDRQITRVINLTSRDSDDLWILFSYFLT